MAIGPPSRLRSAHAAERPVRRRVLHRTLRGPARAAQWHFGQDFRPAGV